MKNLTLYSLILLSFIFSENKSQSFFTGNANFYYISKLDDGSIINMPYRMLNTSWVNRHNDFELIGTLALEYQPRNNYSYLMDNPQDFLLDLRELYLTWFTNFGEIRLGKQIQSWGFVEENSPIDNSSAYDYNFLFETGTDRKIATNSLSMDMFYKNLKFGFTATPFHQINRLPSSNADFPIELPVIPQDYQFMDIDNANEFGGYLQLSTDLIDIGISYFNGYDRIYNFAGVNIPMQEGGSAFVYPNAFTGENEVVQDTVFSYRKTQALGTGFSMIISDLILKADLAFFTTKSLADNIERPYYTPDPVINTLYEFSDDPFFTIPSREKVDYYQITAQLEYSFSNDMDILLQYFKHDTTSFISKVPLRKGETQPIPTYNDVVIEGFDPEDYFYPGMGSPLALITSNAALFGVNKAFYNNKLSVGIKNIMDLNDYSGFLVEFDAEYKLSDRISSLFAINYVKGDETHPNSNSSQESDYDKALDYPFNQMEGFSHFRMQVKYSF